VAVLIALVGLVGVRGADYPAHVFRAEFWRRAADASWNFAWYGGHSVAPYGVLSPPIVATLGPFLAVALATVVATGAFASIVHHSFAPRTASLAAYAFAVTAVVDVVVGRVAFGVGLAFGLLAVVAWQQGQLGWTLVGTLATTLASPVAGALLGLCGASVAIGGYPRSTDGAPLRGRATGLAVAAVSTAPLALVSLAFGAEGEFPFRGGHLAMTLVVAALVGFVVTDRVVRTACALSCIVALTLFLIPNAMGGNFVRLPQIVGIPLLIAAVVSNPPARPVRRAALWAGMAFAVLWSASPAVVAAGTWHGDTSVGREYFAPLVTEVQRRNAAGAPGRLEIPFTANHWEAAWVATEVPYARGWERQLDRARNRELYESDLDVATYRAWLYRNAVRWIAVPHAPLDHSGHDEAQLVLGAERADEDWLRRVWQHPDWTLFEVVDHRPLVGAGAELVDFDVGALAVRVDRPGAIELQIVHSRTLTIWPSGCLARTADGGVRAVVPISGTYRITSALWDARRSHDCASP
jgi:hypothetical protein